MANGRGGQVDPASALAREPFLVVAELTGAAAASRIVLAAAITLDEIESRFADKIDDRDVVTFDANSASLRARRSRRLGSLVVAEQIKQVTPDAETARVLAQGLVGWESTGSTGARLRCNCVPALAFCAKRKAMNGPISRTMGWRAA